jgi:hypothetical protein
MIDMGPSETAKAAITRSSVGSSVGKYPFFAKFRATRGNMRAIVVSFEEQIPVRNNFQRVPEKCDYQAAR